MSFSCRKHKHPHQVPDRAQELSDSFKTEGQSRQEIKRTAYLQRIELTLISVVVIVYLYILVFLPGFSSTVAVDTLEPRTASVEVLGSSSLIAASIAAWWPFTASVTLHKLTLGCAPRSDHSVVALVFVAIQLSNQSSLVPQDSCFGSVEQ